MRRGGPSGPPDRHMDQDTSALLVELIEKIGLLRRDMQHRQELEKYEARFKRIEQKFNALAERLSRDNPDLAKALRTAWQLPARSLAFRNADHQKDSKNE
jgi:hypothetical protein